MSLKKLLETRSKCSGESSDKNLVTNFFLAPNVYFTDRKVVNMAIFRGLKRLCQRGIWDYERENYIFRCALLK